MEKKYPNPTYLPNVKINETKTANTPKPNRLRRPKKKHHPQKPKRKRSTRVSVPSRRRNHLRAGKTKSRKEVPEEELQK